MNKKLFGTDGIRTRMGTYPLRAQDLPQLSKALGIFILNRYGSGAKVLIAHDTRASCDYIKSQLFAGLLSYPINIFDAGVLPTPAAHALINHNSSFSCALIISASHNPHHDNGIKIIDAQHGKLTANDEEQIEAALEQDHVIEYNNLGTLHYYPTAAADYKALIKQSIQNLNLAGMHIVLDCAHGATSLIAPQLFEEFGATVITIHNTPNGSNINDRCGSLHPEYLAQKITEYNATIGFAFDGDGDRITVINNQGQERDGDALLALLTEHPRYRNEKTIIGTIMSNQGLESFAHSHQKQLIRTPVGDKYIAQALAEHNALIGGEPSGHIILRDFIPSSDGIFAALRILELMIATNNMTLQTFTPYPQVLINVTVKEKKELTDEPFANLIAATQTQLPHGRIIVRYSGTEPLLRIMIEDANREKAQALGTQLAQELAQNLC